ncbi:hypothetical protein AVEN_243558-1 [Araneus ventricosus]|uniref:Uncharacterized protein n=1 Tax=Araneus ventricosus TaxID=182803 RepID=A0A4Y2A546_ARAVE|nr:hypothetical protein AVEN_243558-1 [Araneus ventricosus]
MPKRKAIFLSRLGPETTVNDITNFLTPLNLKFLQCHRLKTKYQSYASFHINVYENDLKQLLRVYSGTPGWVGRRHFFRTLTTGKVRSPNPTGGTRIDLLDSTVWPEGCLIAELYGKLRNDQISQEVIPRSDSNHPSCFLLPTNTDSK